MVHGDYPWHRLLPEERQRGTESQRKGAEGEEAKRQVDRSEKRWLLARFNQKNFVQKRRLTTTSSDDHNSRKLILLNQPSALDFSKRQMRMCGSRHLSYLPLTYRSASPRTLETRRDHRRVGYFACLTDQREKRRRSRFLPSFLTWCFYVCDRFCSPSRWPWRLIHTLIPFRCTNLVHSLGISTWYMNNYSQFFLLSLFGTGLWYRVLWGYQRCTKNEMKD